MTERAALYTVAVRHKAKRGNGLPLGDIDGAGTSLASVLAGILDGFAETSADGARVVRALVARRDGEDLFAVVQHGQKGVAADIVGPCGCPCASGRRPTISSSSAAGASSGSRRPRASAGSRFRSATAAGSRACSSRG